MSYVTRAIHYVSQLICWVSGFALVGMMALTSADVIGRYIGYPIKGTYDVAGLLGAFVVALPLAYTQMLRRHVAMEFMETHGSRLIRMTVSVVVSLLGIGVYALIAWRTFLLGSKFWTVGRVSDTIEIPMYPFVYVVAFGCALNCLVLIVDLYQTFAEPKKSASLN